MTTTTNDINFNAVNCLKEVADLGHTTYVNVCNGAQSTVPWGAVDWMGFVLLTAIVLLLLGFFGTMLFKLLFDNNGY